MPTIDQLAPASSASDTDELITSQGGVTRKITRAQVLNGYQEEILLAPQSLIGRVSSGVGALEVICIGPNLSFNGNTLAASASPFIVSQLQHGVVPNASDLIPICQGASNVSVSYGDFLSGFSNSIEHRSFQRLGDRGRASCGADAGGVRVWGAVDIRWLP